MHLFDISLGVSRSHSVRDKSTVLNVYMSRILKAVVPQFNRNSRSNRSRLTRKPGNMQCLQSSAANCGQQVSFFVICSTNNWKITSFTVSLSAVYIACQEMACRKILERCHICTILIAGVSYNTQIMGLKILLNCYIFMF